MEYASAVIAVVLTLYITFGAIAGVLIFGGAYLIRNQGGAESASMSLLRWTTYMSGAAILYTFALLLKADYRNHLAEIESVLILFWGGFALVMTRRKVAEYVTARNISDMVPEVGKSIGIQIAMLLAAVAVVGL